MPGWQTSSNPTKCQPSNRPVHAGRSVPSFVRERILLVMTESGKKWITLYVLELRDGCFYVAESGTPESRINDHVIGKGSQWTRKHPLIRVTERRPAETTDRKDAEAIENEVTLMLMRKHGWQRVRGGFWCSVALAPKCEARVSVDLEDASAMLVLEACLWFQAKKDSRRTRESRYAPSRDSPRAAHAPPLTEPRRSLVMTWSSTRTSTSANAALTVCVRASSERLGSHTPLG